MTEIFVPDPPSHLHESLRDLWREGYRSFVAGAPRDALETSWSKRDAIAKRWVKAWHDGYDAAARARGGQR